MKILYFDCFSGISGDMTIGALLDAGASFDYLQSELKKLELEDEYELKHQKVVKNGISSIKFDVILHNQHEHHHHHEGHHHSHEHRHYSDITKLIQEADYNERVTTMCLKVFELIARAEAKIHDMSLEKVHFHEVGAVDSIIDIVGTAILLDQLEIDEFVSGPIPAGNGMIKIDHGIYPVPAPATMELLKGIPLKQTTIEGELTTPTGAGFIKALCSNYSGLPEMRVDQIGYGAGTKTFDDHPNVLRIMIGEKS
ncbi:nickel pincer cofactor biosynthesis protein LarC [Pseudalkalibacillus sp. R45]|uniref:nickel pincer cofactor biosynthesis protein LarC n=1 Tax=Pseudalkalibacillus sp. R45 TaxID=3457433 RepID=UPI003FCE1BE3